MDNKEIKINFILNVLSISSDEKLKLFFDNFKYLKILFDKNGITFPKGFILHTKGISVGLNDCFMDSVLIAMFIYHSSPFFDGFERCKNKEICVVLDKIRCNVLSGNTQNIRNLRDCLNINLKGNDQQDAQEFLTYLFSFINFEKPMLQIKETNVYLRDIDEDKITKTTNSIEDTNYIMLNLGESKNPIHDYLNNSEWEELDIDDYVRNKEDLPFYNKKKETKEIYKINYNCIIFYINRIKWIQEEQKSIVSKSEIESPEFIYFGDSTYFRCAVVCHLGKTPRSGHYITIIFDGYKYYKFNDLDTTTTIYNNEITNEKGNEIISKNGVFFFYYKQK